MFAKITCLFSII